MEPMYAFPTGFLHESSRCMVCGLASLLFIPPSIYFDHSISRGVHHKPNKNQRYSTVSSIPVIVKPATACYFITKNRLSSAGYQATKIYSRRNFHSIFIILHLSKTDIDLVFMYGTVNTSILLPEAG
jgi:hypothetical protein